MVTTTVDISGVLAGLDEMARRGKDLRPVFREMRKIIAADLKQHFAARSSPDGQWAPWAQSSLDRMRRKVGTGTKRSRAKRSARLLRLISNQLGDLKRTWKFFLDPDGLAAWNWVPWSGVHQDGGSSPRGGSIPARPFAWLSPRTVDAFVDLVLDFVGGAW